MKSVGNYAHECAWARDGNWTDDIRNGSCDGSYYARKEDHDTNAGNAHRMGMVLLMPKLVGVMASTLMLVIALMVMLALIIHAYVGIVADDGGDGDGDGEAMVKDQYFLRPCWRCDECFCISNGHGQGSDLGDEGVCVIIKTCGSVNMDSAFRPTH